MRRCIHLIIDVRGLRKSFRGRGGTVEAVRGVDLGVRAGEVFGFLGPNGAGKTTTVRVLATLLAPTAAEHARVAGHDLLREPGRVRERIGYVSQQGGADGYATVRDNLTLQARLTGMSRARAAERTAAMLELLELGAVADRPAVSLSGGQRRRLSLALGMIHQPALLFLDEPTTGLDPHSRARLWEEVRRLRGRGTCAFLTTHYLEEADALCDRLAIIDHGRIVAEGTPEALRRGVGGDVVTVQLDGDAGPDAAALVRGEALVREATLDKGTVRAVVTDGEAAVPALLRALDRGGCPVRGITFTRPSLDDVFLRQTGRSLREQPEPAPTGPSAAGRS